MDVMTDEFGPAMNQFQVNEKHVGGEKRHLKKWSHLLVNN